MYRWLSWQQYGSGVDVIHGVVSPSTRSIVLRVNATCAYTWRAPFAHLDPMHSLTAAPCPIISEYDSNVKDMMTLTKFNNIAIQGTPQMAVDKEAILCLSIV